MKVGIIGTGMVGSSTTYRLIEKGVADKLVMTDIIEGMPQGKGLDMLEATPILGVDVDVLGSNDLADLEGCDIVVCTAGFPRQPGMTRMDLLKKNLGIVKPCAEGIRKHAPDSKVIVVTNPLDIMTYATLKTTGFEPNRVCGMAGMLDTTRFKTFVAMELGVSVRDVVTIVLGGHGDSMVPLPRYSNVSGIPITDLLSQEQIDRIVDRTRKAGTEIVSLLKKGSAFYAPGAAIADMVESIAKDLKRIMPACTYLDGEYGFKDVCAGVPVILGKNGVEKVIELKLNEDERAQFSKSVNELVETIDQIKSEKLI